MDHFYLNRCRKSDAKSDHYRKEEQDPKNDSNRDKNTVHYLHWQVEQLNKNKVTNPYDRLGDDFNIGQKKNIYCNEDLDRRHHYEEKINLDEIFEQDWHQKEKENNVDPCQDVVYHYLHRNENE